MSDYYEMKIGDLEQELRESREKLERLETMHHSILANILEETRKITKGKDFRIKKLEDMLRKGPSCDLCVNIGDCGKCEMMDNFEIDEYQFNERLLR